MTAPRMLPDVGYVDHAEFWAGTRVGELRVQRCRRCELVRWLPRPVCPQCHDDGPEWTSVDPVGRLFSFIVVHHATMPSFADRTPYAVGIVELDQHPQVRFTGIITHADPENLSIGMPMRADFEEVSEDVTLVNWRPLNGAS